MNTLIQNAPNREELAFAFLATIPFTPYPVQEEAILGWYSTDQGILVCAPTGTGKTLIAECAVYEALRLGKTLYYTTPLIALTDQKLEELRASIPGPLFLWSLPKSCSTGCFTPPPFP